MRLGVLLPTRNRSDLLPEAIASALDDSRTHVLVSDNSTEPGDIEEAARICATFPAERVRRIRPPQPMPMAEHWEWAVGEALSGGEVTHLTILTDRMILRRGALAELLAIVEHEPDRVLSYGYDTLKDHEDPVLLQEMEWTGRLFEITSKHLTEMTARGLTHVALPRMMNSIAPRETLGEMRREHGTIFGTFAPDIRFAFRCLDSADVVLYRDSTPLLHRALDRSTGWSMVRGDRSAAHAEFVSDGSGHPVNPDAPIPELATMHNVIFSEYEHVRKSSKSGRFPALPRRHYLGLNAESVAMLEVPEVRERMGALLAEHGWSRRTRRLRAIELELLKAPFLLSHPSLLLRRRVPHWRRTWRAFPTPEDALGRFHAGPRPPLAYVEELWPLLRPRGGARELPLP